MSQRPSPGSEHDASSARIRNLVIDRLLRMNARHATFAWLSRRSHPIGPHGIAFLYGAQTRPAVVEQPAAFVVCAATRLVDDGDDVRQLPRLLYRLRTLAQERYLSVPGGFDPIVHMCNRHDPMPANATYLGVAVSSLDTEAATWERVKASARGPLDLPGRCFVVLRDTTQILIERGAQDVFGEVRVHSSRELNVIRGVAQRPWTPCADLSTMPGTADIWRQLRELNAVTAGQRDHIQSRRIS